MKKRKKKPFVEYTLILKSAPEHTFRVIDEHFAQYGGCQFFETTTIKVWLN